MMKIYCSKGWRFKWLSVAVLLISFESKAFIQDSASITIHASNTSIEMVFRQIERQTGYSFFYSKPTLDGNELISVNLKKSSLTFAMNTILKGKNVNWQLKDGGIVLSRKTAAMPSNLDTLPKVNVSGQVVDPQGGSIAGATVSIKGQNRGQGTDNNGRFTFVNIPSNATLTISSLGYEAKQFRLSGQSEIRITLDTLIKEIQSVEVLSTGYQKIPKERATGSFDFISNDLINRKVSTDILSRIDGITSGVLFDKRNPADPKIQIRGLYTLSEEIAQPLIVLDKFPFEGDIRDINPNDVENITILKDAAAASIWGAKAGNGVIVITTKQGKASQPLRISFNSNISYSQKPDLFKLKELNTTEFIEAESFLFDKGYYNSSFNDIFTPVSPVVDILRRKRSGEITEAQSTQLIDAYRNRNVRNDFMKYIYRNELNQQYALSLSAGSRDMQSYVSVGYDKNLSNLVGNDYQRVSLRSNTNFQPIKKMNIQVSLAYSQGNSNNNSPGEYSDPIYSSGSGRVLYAYTRLADEFGNPLDLDSKYNKNYTDTAGKGMLQNWKSNPLKDLRNANNTTISKNLIADLSVRYELIKGLSAEVSYRYQTDNTEGKNYRNKEMFFTRDLINTYTQINNGVIKYVVPNEGILDLSYAKQQGSNLRGMLNFDRLINEKNYIAVIAGGEVREIRGNSNRYRTYGYSDKLGYTNMDYADLYPLYTGGNAVIPNFYAITATRDRYVAAFMNASYSYSGKYIVSASVRKDASNLFGVNSNQKGRPFGSAGLSWRISEETFYNSSWVPSLSIRATYGYSGNVNQSGKALTVLAYVPNQTINGLPAARITTAGNPELRWENLTTLNLGVDFILYKNFASGSLEYYKKKSTDVIGAEIMNPTTGITTLPTNSASLKGEGVDLRLNFNVINNSSLNYKISTSFSYVKYIVSEFKGNKNSAGNTSTGELIIPTEGENPYSVISHRWGGLDPNTGDPRGYLNGKLTKSYDSLANIGFNPISNQVIHGSALPKFYGNILNSVAFQNFSLSFNISYRLGYFYRRPSITYGSLINTGQGNSDYSRRWKKPGDEKFTNVPSMIYPNINSRDAFYKASEVNVVNAGHVRLEDIRIGYTLPQVLKNTRIKNLEIYSYMSNLNILLYNAGIKGEDPNSPSGLVPSPSFSGGIRAMF